VPTGIAMLSYVAITVAGGAIAVAVVPLHVRRAR
jgi:hypothetical protein